MNIDVFPSKSSAHWALALAWSGRCRQSSWPTDPRARVGLVATGLIRETAALVQAGLDLDDAIKEATRGASRPVEVAYLALIRGQCPRGQHLAAANIQRAILDLAALV